MSTEVGLGLGLTSYNPLVTAMQRLFRDANLAVPGKGGSQNGSVTWTGGTGGQFLNPWTGALQNTNLLLYSQDYSQSAWTQTNVTATYAQTAPDGSPTATKLKATATGSCTIRQTLTTVTATTYTVSFMFSNVDAGFGMIAVDDGTTTNVRKQFYNLTTGVVGTTTQTGTYVKVSANQTDLLNGFFRCDLTFTTPAGTTTRVYAGFANADGTDSLTINLSGVVWAAQGEIGDTATDYVPTLAVPQAHLPYYRDAGPGFSKPVVPSRFFNGTKWLLNAPFRHDYRIGQNMLLQSGFDGAVSGTPGTAPTSWTFAVNTGSLVVPSAGQLTFQANNIGERECVVQTVSVAANTSYFFSFRVLAITGPALPVGRAITAVSLPAGATITNYYRNGVVANSTDPIAAGDTLGVLISVAGTAGTAGFRAGAFVATPADSVSSITITEPQCEPGLARTTYTPTTTAAIAAPVCEPVKASEDGILAFFHAQGARTQRCSFPTIVGSSVTGVALAASGAYQRMTVDTSTGLHRVLIGGCTSSIIGTPTAIKVVFATGGTVPYIYINAAAAVGMSCTVRVSDGAIVGTSGGAWSSQVVNGVCFITGFLVSTATSTTVFIQANDTTAVGDRSYTGNGTDYVDLSVFSLEDGNLPGVTITKQAVALTAITPTWNLVTPTSVTAGEVVLAECPYLWSISAGGTHPAGTSYRLGSSVGDNIEMYKSAGSDKADHKDAATQQTSAQTPATSSGVVRAMSEAWDSVSLRQYHGAVIVGTDVTLSPPWLASTALYPACYRTGGFQWFGGVAPLLFNGRVATDGERSLLASAWNGKTIAVQA